MSQQFLANFWFLALALVWSLYVIQDGFITGASMLSILYKDDEDTYKNINNILGLHWDGIQVWLILAIGGMFAAFPTIYAMTLSSLYVPFFLLLYAIIFRGVAIEVIYKTNSIKVQVALKYILAISSFFITFIIGIYLMNTFLGYPIDNNGFNHQFFAFLSLFNFTAIFGALMFVAVALVQGVNFIRLNTEHQYAPRMYKVSKYAAVAGPFLVACIFLAFANNSNVFARGLFNLPSFALLWLVPLVSIIFFTIGTLAFLKEHHTISFIANIVGVLAFIFTGFLSMIPFAIVSTISSDFSVLITDGAAGNMTLSVLFVALIIFLPVVIGYQAFKYIRFWGKV